MENETPQQSASTSGSSKTPIYIAAAVVVVVVIAIVAFMASGNSQNTSEEAMEAQSNTQEAGQQEEQSSVPAETMPDNDAYKDGSYEAVGNYVSPGGEESIDVTLTLNGGIVEDATVVSNATRPISKQMQASFIGGFEEQVVGKSINEINLTKVAASSLAPKGFNDAIEKIKAQALAES